MSIKKNFMCTPSSSSYLVILISLKNLILCLCFLFTKKNQTTTTERGGEIAYRITMKKEWKKNWLWFLKKKFKKSTEKLLTVPLFNRMCFFSSLYLSLYYSLVHYRKIENIILPPLKKNLKFFFLLLSSSYICSLKNYYFCPHQNAKVGLYD